MAATEPAIFTATYKIDFIGIIMLNHSYVTNSASRAEDKTTDCSAKPYKLYIFSSTKLCPEPHVSSCAVLNATPIA